MGYHTKDFKKGVFGEFSKVQEEWDELLDARAQDGKILELCELSDLYGAIEGYVKTRFNMTMDDIAKMSRMTSSAFEEGKRSSTPPPLPIEEPAPVTIAQQPLVIQVTDEDLRDNLDEWFEGRREQDGVCGWCNNEGEVGPPEDRYVCPCGIKR